MNGHAPSPQQQQQPIQPPPQIQPPAALTGGPPESKTDFHNGSAHQPQQPPPTRTKTSKKKKKNNHQIFSGEEGSMDEVRARHPKYAFTRKRKDDADATEIARMQQAIAGTMESMGMDTAPG